jgi:hypothetical protein
MNKIGINQKNQHWWKYIKTYQLDNSETKKLH